MCGSISFWQVMVNHDFTFESSHFLKSAVEQESADQSVMMSAESSEILHLHLLFTHMIYCY
jgi:hypothetical protein